MKNLSELRDRLEKAEGPDRELDVAVAWALGVITERDGNYLMVAGSGEDMVIERDFYDNMGHAPELPSYTTSLDAAIALVEAKLPGWEWKIHANHFNWRAELFEREERHDPVSVEGATRDGGPAIALLLALFSALEKESAE